VFRQYALLDTPPEPDFEALTQAAAQICGAPISLVSLLSALQVLSRVAMQHIEYR
jgi:hypothetical protein